MNYEGGNFEGEIGSDADERSSEVEAEDREKLVPIDAGLINVIYGYFTADELDLMFLCGWIDDGPYDTSGLRRLGWGNPDNEDGPVVPAYLASKIFTDPKKVKK